MSDWDEVDRYLIGALAEEDDALRAARDSTGPAGLSAIEVTANQGKLLGLLAQIAGARRILEFGTLAGYSTIWLARAVGDGGQVVSLEVNPDAAAVARENVDRAGVGEWVEILVGPAAHSVAGLEGPFDFVFIDADKANQAVYLEAALPLVPSGGVIVGDNVVRDGAVSDAASNDPSVQGIRSFIDLMAATPGLDATAVQTVGSKGWDGFSVARVA